MCDSLVRGLPNITALRELSLKMEHTYLTETCKTEALIAAIRRNSSLRVVNLQFMDGKDDNVASLVQQFVAVTSF